MRDYLISRGMNVSVVDCNEPISKVICNYIGVVGFSSAALRDARAVCNYAFIMVLQLYLTIILMILNLHLEIQKSLNGLMKMVITIQ